MEKERLKEMFILYWKIFKTFGGQRNTEFKKKTATSGFKILKKALKKTMKMYSHHLHLYSNNVGETLMQRLLFFCGKLSKKFRKHY